MRGSSSLTATKGLLPAGPTGLALRWLHTDSGRGFRALRHQPFRRVYASFVLQQLGFWTSHLSLQGVVDDVSGNDPVAVSWLFVALLAPTIVIGPLAGVIADRHDRRKIMMHSYAATGLGAAALAVLVWAVPQPSLAALYALATLQGVTFSLVGPAFAAGIADSVTFEDLPSGISLQAAASNITRVVGPIAAAAMIAAGRHEMAFALFAAACAVAVVVLRGARLRPYKRDVYHVSVLGRLRDGLRHAYERPPALRALRTVAVTATFGVGHVALIPAFTAQQLGGEPGQFAWVVAATGAGAIVGALVQGYSRSPITLASGARAQLIYGLCFAAFAVTSSLRLAIVAQVAVGYFYFVSMTRMQTLLQNLAADAKRARVMSLFTLCWAGVVWIGALLMGFAAGPGGLSLRATLLAAAGVCIIHGIYTTLTAPKHDTAVYTGL